MELRLRCVGARRCDGGDAAFLRRARAVVQQHDEARDERLEHGQDRLAQVFAQRLRGGRKPVDRE
eukprot:6206636-Pleurochrysis_carterae.AAC.4